MGRRKLLTNRRNDILVPAVACFKSIDAPVLWGVMVGRGKRMGPWVSQPLQACTCASIDKHLCPRISINAVQLGIVLPCEECLSETTLSRYPGALTT